MSTAGQTHNRIAIYGHRSWAGAPFTQAIAAAGAPVKVLYRPGSDISGVPAGVTCIEVDIDDKAALITVLEDVDILISCVGRDDIMRQQAFIEALPHTKVRLFVPSNLGYRCDESGRRIPMRKMKQDIEDAAVARGIPIAIVVPGSFAESTFSVGLLGIDIANNRIVYTGDSANQKMNICTQNYVAAAYASIFAATPPEKLAGRTIGISELQVTGREIAAAMTKKSGQSPTEFHHTLQEVEDNIDSCLKTNSPLAAVWDYRRVWGNGEHVKMIQPDVWEVPNYEKATLEDLLVNGKLEPYKDVDPRLIAAVNSTFY
ncbi:hypothetical protein G7054_g11008 [Neopestalotiopsis clavispora]|nr:hypothetical protein G7054_g11008 [Neopestalotiopsis clavispora]